MNYKNSKIAIFTPLALAVALIAGIWIGKSNTSSEVRTAFLPRQNYNKLDVLLDVIEENYVDSIDKTALLEDVIPDVLENLDPHSVYIPKKDIEEVQEPLKGNFEGIGVQFNIKDDTIFIVNTISGGPSEKAGLLPGDRIVSINDSVFVGKSLTNRMVINNLKGEKGTTVEVGVKRQGIKDLLDFTITRDEIPLHSVDVGYMLDDSTGYIKISRFAQTTHDEFVDHAVKLKENGMKQIVLDLRLNSGGYLNAAKNLADEFLPKDDLIVYTQGRARRLKEYYATEQGMLEDLEVIVLIDSWSASASEIVAGAVQDQDRGLIIGQRSFGKGLVQEPVVFRDGSVVRLTIARYYTPTGRCIQKSYENGSKAYFHDIEKRLENGELESPDSIDHPDSLKYSTPAGRVVYGGGGIMPDIFVPLDTVASTPFLAKLRSKAVIYDFALDFTDKHRDELEAYKTPEALYAYLKNQGLLRRLMRFARSKGITPESDDYARSRRYIENSLYAYIGRNMLDNEGYYPILHKRDNTLKRAVEAFQTDSLWRFLTK